MGWTCQAGPAVTAQPHVPVEPAEVGVTGHPPAVLSALQVLPGWARTWNVAPRRETQRKPGPP